MKLTQLIAQYVTFRKSLGEDFESHERRLRTFSRFVGESLDIRSVKADHVAAFLAGHGPITRNWHTKYGALRGFFRYAVTRGYLFTSPLPATVPKQPARFVPHIYSMDELRRLLDGTASYQKHKSRILMEPHTFRAILLLLYGAALRVSEALSLNLADVDLEEAPYDKIPTMKELGYDVSYESTNFAMGPPKMPKDVVDLLVKAIKQAVKEPDYVKFCTERNARWEYIPPEKVVPLFDKRRIVVREIMSKAGILKESK